MYWRYCDRINISCGEIPFLVFLSDVIIKWNSALNEMFLGCSACHSFPRLLHCSVVPFVQQQQFNSRIALFHIGSSGMCGKLRSSAVGHALLLLVDSSKSVYLAGLNTCGWMWLCCGKLGRVFIKLCPAGNLFSFWKYDRTVLLHAARLSIVLAFWREMKPTPKVLGRVNCQKRDFPTGYYQLITSCLGWRSSGAEEHMPCIFKHFPSHAFGMCSAERKIKLESCRCRW